MKSDDDLDRQIDALLQDAGTQPEPDFTARVLERLVEDQVEDKQETRPLLPFWFILPVAAAIALALLPAPNVSDELQTEEKDNALAWDEPPTTIDPFPLSAEIEELLAMEDSLRDFEILFDEDALEILALLDE
ncbi:MAG: hypothetical protein VB980_07095 [Opitutales bacterium]|jgi:hypothetical protein